MIKRIERIEKMTLNEVPPKRRKAILVISEHESDRLEYTPGGNELLLSEQVHLLVPSYVTTGDLEEKLDSSGLLEPGSLLIQSPYDTSDYVILNKASSTFVLSKYLHFTTLCGLLGAREVTVEQIEVKTLTGKQIFKGSLDSPYSDGKIEAINRIFEEIRNNIKLQSKFDGGEPDLEKAENHLRQYQLSNDISMKSLIDQRKGKNPIKSRELTLSLSEESKRNLQVITDIKVPVYANLQAQIEQFRKEVYEFTLSIKVEF
jgi:hypothetical protein